MNEENINIILFGIVALIVLILRVFAPRIKGKIGEAKISVVLNLLNSNKYIVLNNVLITDKSRSSQIDHIVISNYGVFVIETKNYKGWIFGHESSNYWTQTLYKNKYKFRNPIMQNWGHIKTLQTVLSEFDFIQYYPIIVFTGNATLKRITSKVPVIKTHKLLAYIRKNSTTECLSNEDVNQVHQKLIGINRKDKASRKTHLRKAKSLSRINLKMKSCPRCGGKLALKQGKYGKFQGCSNFPNCTFTKGY